MLAAHSRRVHPSQHSSRAPCVGARKYKSARAISAAPGIEVELAAGFRASFPATGSGLLWARSTGLKVWDGAKVLSQLLLLPDFPDSILELHPTYSAHLSSSSSSGGGSGGDKNFRSLEGLTVVELGAGLGLCSVAAAHRGAQVTATDGDADLVRLLKKNLAFNNGETPAASARQLRLERQALLSEQQHTDDSASNAMCVGDVGSAPRPGQASTSGRSDVHESSGVSSFQQHARFLHAPRAHLLPWGNERAANELKHTILQREGTHHEFSNAHHNHNEHHHQQQQHQHQQQQQQQQQQQEDDRAGQQQTSTSGSPDLILMAEVVYGSDPGVWEALIKTLKALSSPGTLILQAESRRIEGVLYGEYWAALEREGFHIVELPLPQLLGPDLCLGLHSHKLAAGSDVSSSGSEASASAPGLPGAGAQVKADSDEVHEADMLGAGMQRSAQEQESAKGSDSGDGAGCSAGRSAEGRLSEAQPSRDIQTGMSEVGRIGVAEAARHSLLTSRHPHVRAWAIHNPMQ